MFVHVMARANLPAKKYKKSNPTQLRLSFEASGNTTRYIDIAQALSAINRKFYRQGLYYYVNSVEVYNDEQAVVDILTLPDTWVTKNAWNRGFQLFQKMNSMTDEPLSGVGRPKYHDFKVYMDANHRAGHTSTRLKPHAHYPGGDTEIGANAEWVYSEFVSADDDGDATQEADNFNVHMVGAHNGSNGNWDSIGLIASYATSRITVDSESPNDSQVVSSDPLLNIFDMSSEEQMNDIIDNLKTDNDAPPYDLTDYLGESYKHLQHVARVGTEVGLGRVGRAAGFCAPMGLLCISTNASTDYRIVLNLAPGTYHGVYAERA
jgi:hypothetical protein